MVVQSSCDVEYKTMVHGTCEIMWLYNLFKDFNLT